MTANLIRLTVVITAWKEAKTVARLVKQLEEQLSRKSDKFEILLIAPDKETGKAGLGADKLEVVKWLKDEGKGKPAALNKAFKVAQGDILILTDGDIRLGSRAIELLLRGFRSDMVGAVTARPVPLNSKDNLFGFWAHLLAEAGAHQQRLKQEKKNDYIDASGYLLAVKRGLLARIPENTLADDAFISRTVWNKGYQISYQPEAKVYVKYPDNFKDWLVQKKRTAGGYVQLDRLLPSNRKGKMRTFWKESWGIKEALSYPRRAKELWWTVLLIFARLYLWLLVFWERKVMNKSFEKTWLRVKSTKE